MRFSGVGSDEDQQVGGVDIFHPYRDVINSEGFLVSDDGAGHAGAGVGVAVGGADKPFGEFVGDVVVFVEHLPR